MEGQFEAEAMVESKRDGQPPFMREKPQMLPILEDKPAKLSCLAVGDPKPVVQWFKCVIHLISKYIYYKHEQFYNFRNENLVAEGKRVTITEDSQGRSILSFNPALPNDAGIYKVVARNRVRY
jgi:Immunoglobulin I-set domain